MLGSAPLSAVALTAAPRSGAAPTEANLSSVGAAPGSVPADATTPSTITVTLTDAGGSPIVGATVALAAGGGGSSISAASGTSDAGGVVTFSVTDATPESVVYTATDTTNAVVILQTATVVFSALPSAFAPGAGRRLVTWAYRTARPRAR